MIAEESSEMEQNSKASMTFVSSSKGGSGSGEKTGGSNEIEQNENPDKAESEDKEIDEDENIHAPKNFTRTFIDQAGLSYFTTLKS